MLVTSTTAMMLIVLSLVATLIARYPFAVAAARSPFLISVKSQRPYLNRSILHAWMLRDKLNGMIEVSRLKDVNAAELFLGFRIGAVGRRDFAVFPVGVNAVSG